MPTTRNILRFALLGIFLAIGPLTLAVAQTGPDERDRQVLECLLLHLLSDPNFETTRVPKVDATIVLHTNTPEKSGFLNADQIRSDIGDRTLPSDAESDIRQRNTPADVNPATYDAVKATYTNLTFATGVVVTDLNHIWKQGRRSSDSFKVAHPTAKGWLKSYLPGYSKNGSHAVVRAGIGPTAHSEMITAVLENRRGMWVVKWYHISRYL